MTRKGYGALLWVLTALFFLRVFGQALVAFLDPRFLPPMAEWSSGLIPYPILLPLQVLILLLQARSNSDVTRRAGFFAAPRPRVGRFLLWFSALYFSAMALRYVVTMALHPERRWLGGTIPIFFHWVLAAYLFVLARFHLRSAD